MYARKTYIVLHPNDNNASNNTKLVVPYISSKCISDPCSKFDTIKERQSRYLNNFTADIHASSAFHGTFIRPYCQYSHKIYLSNSFCPPIENI
ncbi:hypothetical protein V1478_014070 [Vespula squamosa]|uniref:Uncharacterized protein n=1 Tax=Vespula squamosa TaxID=30214 RepID=A0ABD2A6Z9_VESSQ